MLFTIDPASSAILYGKYALPLCPL